jgi:parvulin-like peptidyl-prolyl isomerase
LFRKIASALLLVAAGLALLVLGCASTSSDTEDPVVAQVGSQKLHASELKVLLDERRATAPENKKYEVTPEMVMDEWINGELISQEAKNRGYDKDPDIQRKVDEYLTGLLVEKMWTEEVEKKVDSVSEQEVTDFYNSVKDTDYKSKYPQVRLSLLTVRGAAEAMELAQRARNGEDFAQLVAQYSIRKDLGLDGDMGYSRKEELPKKLAEVAFNMQVGEISDPIKFEVGYSIIKITGKVEPGEYMPLDDKERKQLEDRVLLEKRKQYALDFIDQLKKNTEVFKFLHKYQDAIESGGESK